MSAQQNIYLPVPFSPFLVHDIDTTTTTATATRRRTSDPPTTRIHPIIPALPQTTIGTRTTDTTAPRLGRNRAPQSMTEANKENIHPDRHETLYATIARTAVTEAARARTAASAAYGSDTQLVGRLADLRMSGRGGAGVDVGSVSGEENAVVGGELRGRRGRRTDAEGNFVIWEEGQVGGWRPETRTGEGLYLAGDQRRADGPDDSGESWDEWGGSTDGSWSEESDTWEDEIATP